MIKKLLPGLLVVLLIAALWLPGLHVTGIPPMASTPRATRGSGLGLDNLTAVAATAKARAGSALGTATAIAATAKALTGSVLGTATAIAATAQAFVGAARGTVTAIAATATALHLQVIGADEASAAITSYALQVLGTQVTVKRASGLSTSDLSGSLPQPPESATAQVKVSDLAMKSYAATLENGAASLSYGSGILSGDINVDVQGASLGVYSLVMQTETGPDANTGLDFAKKVFPNLAGLQYEPYPVTAGYGWIATGAVPAIDPKNYQMGVTTQTVILYVLPGSGGHVNVTATVGRGDFATALQVP